MSGYWSDPEYVHQHDHVAHQGFLLAEDAALKHYLSGMRVPDRDGDMPVDVWFRWPESERRIRYPFITIDLLDIQADYTRWFSHHKVDPRIETVVEGDTQVQRSMLYYPSVSPSLGDVEGDNTGFHVEPYLMHKIMYQVSVHCRSALHDRILNGRMMVDVLGPRPFWIPVTTDNTWRRTELAQFQAADSSETTETGSKRIFRKVYTIYMDAEIPQSRVYEIPKVLAVHADFYEKDQKYRELPNHPVDGDHNIAVDHFTVEHSQ